MGKVRRMDKKWRISLVVTFLICFIPRMLFGPVLIPYAVYDEGPAMAVAAYFAGKDWSGVTSISGYYGFGYYALFAPLFKGTDNPYKIYFVIVEINAFVQAFYGVIAFAIMRKFFKLENIYIVIVFSCICSYLTTVRPVIYNEIPLVFLNWIIAFFLCFLVKNRLETRKKFYGTLVLFALMAYALTIHIRSIILPAALFVVVLIYWLVYKEWFISLKAIPFGISFMAAALYVVKLVQNIIWKSGERINVANTEIDLGISQLNLADLTTWKGFFLVLAGQISTINLFSGGLFIMALYVLIKYAVLSRKNARNAESSRYYLAVALLFLLCCFGMVAGQAISWMYTIYPSLLNHEVGDVSGYKAFSYIRYMGAFIGPFVLCALVMIQHNESFLKRADIVRITLCNLLVLLLWNAYVAPLLDGNPYALEAYAPFCFRKAHDPIGMEQYRAALPWYLIICIFLLFSFVVKNLKVYYAFALGLLIFQVSYMAIYNDSYYGEERSRAAAVCYDFFEELSDNVEMPKKIYSYGMDSQRLQFYLNNYQVKPVIPDDILEDTVLLYQGKLTEWTDIDLEEWNYISLDSNVYFFFQKEELRKYVIAMGYDV